MDGTRPGDNENIPGKEPGTDPENPTPPTDEAATFDCGEGSKLLLGGQVNNAADFGDGIADAIVNISCPDGIEELKVKIISDDLTDEFLSGVGLAAEFDIANPGEFKDGLEGLGFDTNIKDKTEAQFDITGFMSLLGIYSGIHSFEISVKANGNPTPSKETLTFKVD